MKGLTLHEQPLSDGWMSLAVEGEIDLATVDELQKAINGIADNGGQHLVIDLTGSSFMDSTGLKALVMASRRFDEEGRSFAIAVSGGPVSRLIDLSGVNTSIRIVDRAEDAVSGAG
ncbi:MAG TPA: STAS domain-containing protein [Acidimicrobiia bacterium]|jgi:anti-anti-sigma factor|nr:STAS domain-containing protein [Acidimicrobiia bacterium]